MIILCGGEKGGSSKSTSAINLAAEFAFLGYKVGLLDSDEKTSAKNWTVSRNSLTSFVNDNVLIPPLDVEDINEIPKSIIAKLKKEGIPSIEGKHATGDIIDTIINMSKRNDILIIDVGGGDTEEFHLALGMCDIAIFPLQPSILDYDTVPKLVKNLSLAKARHPKLIIRSLISNAPTAPRSNVVRKFKVALEQTTLLSNMFKTVIKNRDAYKDCLNYGLAVREWKDSSAKGEFSCLAQEVLNIINESRG